MSEYKLSDTISCSVEEAREIIKNFFNKVPKVQEYLDKCGNFSMQKGYIITSPPFRRRRFFIDAHRAWEEGDTYTLGKIERAGKNTPIQGTNADITKLAMVRIYKEIEDNQYPVRIILSVYDEIQTECREDFAESWRVILQSIMEGAAKEIITSVPVIAECKISDYWDH